MRPKVAPVLVLLITILFAIPFVARPAKSTGVPATRPLPPLQTKNKTNTPPPLINAKHPISAQSAEGGLWRTDSNFQSTFMLKNMLEIVPISVTPVLYMADGTEYDLPQVQLDSAGVAMVNINSALANAPTNIQSHISTYGSAAIKFQWGWHAVFAAIRNSDDVRGLIYQTHLEADAKHTHDPTAAQSPQVLQSTWWKQDPDVTGFISLTNTSLNPITVTVNLTDGTAAYSAKKQLEGADNFRVIQFYERLLPGDPRPDAPFQLAIEPQTPSVASGDKIALRITLTNTSEKDLGFRQRARADEAEWDYSIDVRDEKGDAVNRTNYGRNRLQLMTMFSSRVKTVHPGQSLKEEVTLSKLFDFTLPGRYTVQVSRHMQDNDSSQLVKSNTATIIVTVF